MSPLIERQLHIAGAMFCCGILVGLINSSMNKLAERRNITLKVLLGVVKTFAITFLIGDFLMFCDSGKITLPAVSFIFIGVWLWKRKIYGIMYGCKERGSNVKEYGKTKGI